MIGTYAIASDRISGGPDERPLCPSCHGGRLHPYRIDVGFLPYMGVDSLVAWVLVCVGGSGITPEPVGPCGFSVPAQPMMFGSPA